jgi:hypothetical protein
MIFNRKNYIIDKKSSLSENKIKNKNSLVEKLENFSQLNNSNLVIYYHLISIYKIGNNSINLLNKLLGYKEGIDNVIETKNKKMISSSRDKSFKIWEFQ